MVTSINLQKRYRLSGSGFINSAPTRYSRITGQKPEIIKSITVSIRVQKSEKSK
jgi:hypothetical protein